MSVQEATDHLIVMMRAQRDAGNVREAAQKVCAVADEDLRNAEDALDAASGQAHEAFLELRKALDDDSYLMRQ